MTGADLVRAVDAGDRQLLNTITGEVINLDADEETLARTIRALRDLDDDRKLLVKAVSRELLTRMDANAKWTLHFTGLDVSSSSPGKVEYNGERLKGILEELVRDRLITKDAALAAIERKVSFAAKKSGVNALKKLGGEVEKRLRSAEARIPDEKRTVIVKAKNDVVDGGE